MITLKRLGQILRYPYYEIICRIREFDSGADEILENIMSKGMQPENKDNEYTHTFKLNGHDVEFWTSNFPYAYGYVYSIDGVNVSNQRRPSIEMAYRFKKYLAELAKRDSSTYKTEVYDRLV